MQKDAIFFNKILTGVGITTAGMIALHIFLTALLIIKRKVLSGKLLIAYQ